MAKVVVGKLQSHKTAGRKNHGVVVKHVRDAEGRIAKTLRTLDAASVSFGADFQHVFEANVRKARRANKLATGVTDVAIVKR